MITVSREDTRRKGSSRKPEDQKAREPEGRLSGFPAHRLSDIQPCSLLYALCPMLSALLIFLSYNGAAYGMAEHERRDMSQRARAALEEILSTEEFRDQSFQPPWWLKLAERLFRHLPGETRWVGTVLEWLFYLIATLAAVSIFVFAARRFRRLPSFTTDHDALMEPRRHMDSETARARAHECSQRGDYRQAIRYLYLSLLLYLDKAGLLTYDVSRTNGEYLSEIYGSMGSQAEHFAFLTLFFERKWYGMEKSSAGDFQQCEEAVDRLISPYHETS